MLPLFLSEPRKELLQDTKLLSFRYLVHSEMQNSRMNIKGKLYPNTLYNSISSFDPTMKGIG